MAKEKRFQKAYAELGGAKIYVDQVTGVNYLFISEGYGGGLTPLLDRDGKVVVTPTERSKYKGPEL